MKNPYIQDFRIEKYGVNRLDVYILLKLRSDGEPKYSIFADDVVEYLKNEGIIVRDILDHRNCYSFIGAADCEGYFSFTIEPIKSSISKRKKKV